MNKITEMLLKILTGFKDEFAGAYNIRENGLCAARQSSPNIRITVKTDEPGLDIRIDSGPAGKPSTSRLRHPGGRGRSGIQ